MLIGLNGFKSSGKDTVANYLVDHHNFIREAFADRLKLAVGAIFNILPHEIEEEKNNPRAVVHLHRDHLEHSMTFRHFLQKFGTEGGRNIYGQDHWVNLVLPDPDTYAGAEQWHWGKRIVISDVRFPNEIKRIKDLGGYMAQIRRPETDGPDMDHASEVRPDPDSIDYVLYNDTNLGYLHTQVRAMLDDIMSEQTLNGGEFYA